MARIFISHSSADNAEALALRDWLVASGWDDLFLDIDPQRGLVSGQRWLDRLQESSQRCKAVLFVLSRAWLASRYCTAEFWEARKQERPLLAVVIDDTAVDEIPAEMRGVWQLAFLTRGSRFETFSVLPPPDYVPTEVRFSHEGLESLRLGLAQAGLTSFDTASFPWPAQGCEHEADGTTPRRPYRGLKPVDTPDTGVFFGRDADLVRARDHLADLRDRGGRCLVAILGASGSGKSSFLRAGLLPRLARDDRRFLPLPILRPREAAMWGDEGLLAALETAHRQAGLSVTRAALRADLEPGGAGFLRRLADLRLAAAKDLEKDAKPPTLIVPIDQAEELFTTVRGNSPGETGLFLTHLAEILRHGPEALVLITIRSDTYESLQTAEALAGVPQVPFNLPPLAATEYRSVIDGPANRSTDAGRPLTLEPGLATALLGDAQGTDALPLLGFTLERLYVEHGGDGALTLADYGALGGVQGSIEAAVAEAFADPDAAPRIPAGAADREALLKRAFVPHLMGINEANGEPVRRTARLADLPEAARGLIDRLVDHRLLVVDRRVVDSDTEETVIEVAHEALLRRWPTLRRWHDQERAALAMQQEIARASFAWGQNARGPDWLAHRGVCLAEAEVIARREDFAAVFAGVPRAYLDACREAENAARDAEARRLARQRAMQRRVGILLTVVAVVTLAGGWLVVAGRRDLERQTEGTIVANSKAAFDAGYYDRAMRLALVASRSTIFLSPSMDAGIQLGRAAHFSRLEAQLTGHERGVESAAFSLDGTRIVTASDEGTPHVWSRGEDGTWHSVVLKGHQALLTSAAFSPNGTDIVTTGADDSIRVWSLNKGGVWNSVTLGRQHEPNPLASFSPDGAQIVTASYRGPVRVWSRSDGNMWGSVALLEHEASVASVCFSPDNAHIVTTSSDGGLVRVWSRGEAGTWNSVVLQVYGVVSASFSPDSKSIVTASDYSFAKVWSATEAGTWKGIALEGHQGGINSASFAPIGARRIVTASDDGTARIWSPGKDGIWHSVALQGHQGIVNSAAFSRDGARIVTASDDGTARIWDPGKGGIWHSVVLAGHRSGVISASFAPDGTQVVTAARDRTARVWNAGRDGSWASVALGGHREGVSSATFSSNGSQIVTTSGVGNAWIWSSRENGTWHSVVLKGHRAWAIAAFAPGGSRIATASSDSTVRVWSCSEKGVWTCAVLKGHQAEVTSASFSPDGVRLVTASEDGTARVWSRGEDGAWSSVILERHQAWVTSASFSPTGVRIVTASKDHSVRVWSPGETGAWHSIILEGQNEGKGKTSASFSPDGTRIATASGVVRLWSQGKDDAWTSVVLPGTGQRAYIDSVSFSPDGAHIVTAPSFQVWSQGEDGEWTGISLGENLVESAGFSPDGTRIVTTSYHGTVLVWSRGEDGTWTNVDLEGHQGPVRSAAFSPNGTHIVTASDDETARVWDFRWLMGPDDWAKAEPLSLPETVCREKLHGSWTTVKDPKMGRNVERIAERLLTADDIQAAPILAGRVGEDVCAPFLEPRTWWSRLAFWR